jgi:tetratricopeptide (TPR) repeat protein
MSKSMVEKYEQMLAEDPTSTVFVELARAYLERGDSAQAIGICERGISHHPSSVVGHVLWGQALINVGKAAEAMRQFDQATGIDKENPHAYNLIGETLLRKGLFRSALPILRKAAALQPNDGRIAQWLDQAKAALAGGPAPVLYDETTVTMALPESLAPLPRPPAPPPHGPERAGSQPRSPRHRRFRHPRPRRRPLPRRHGPNRPPTLTCSQPSARRRALIFKNSPPR